MPKKVDQYTQMSPLSQLVHRFVSDLAGVQRVLVAVSGGLDSTVLLHAVASARLPMPLLVVHVNHQLSVNAELWQQHVERVCAQLNVPYACERVSVEAHGEGLEQAARTARYQAIGRHILRDDLVLMAHHQMDQVETFLLRLARGAGVTGLGAMVPVRQWGDARLGRPFLRLTRDQLLTYARQNRLTWVEDESNTSEVYDRNYLRSQVLPQMQQRWPSFAPQVAKAADLLRDGDRLLNEYAAQDLQQCEPREERVGRSIFAGALRGWSEARRNLVLRYWLTLQNYSPPSQKQMAELVRLLDAADDQNPLLNWGDCELRRFRGRIYCLPKNWEWRGFDATACELRAGHTITLACGLELQPVSRQTGFAPGTYALVPRSGLPDLKRAHPATRHHSQSVKKLLQEYGLEPWLRDRLPLVVAGEQLVAVADLWVEKAFVSDRVDAIFLRWLPAGDRRDSMVLPRPAPEPD